MLSGIRRRWRRNEFRNRRRLILQTRVFAADESLKV
jgi:hypothetical protein